MSLPVTVLSREEFNNLLEYSTLPAGQTIGKRWKRNSMNRWIMGEYVESKKPGHIAINWYTIQLEDEKPNEFTPFRYFDHDGKVPDSKVTEFGNELELKTRKFLEELLMEGVTKTELRAITQYLISDIQMSMLHILLQD